jgi:hypothetical protein
MLQAMVDGAVVGGTLDEFQATQQFRVQSFGNVTFARDGSHVVRLSVVGRNASAGAFTLSADEIRLAPAGS